MSLYKLLKSYRIFCLSVRSCFEIFGVCYSPVLLGVAGVDVGQEELLAVLLVVHDLEGLAEDQVPKK